MLKRFLTTWDFLACIFFFVFTFTTPGKLVNDIPRLHKKMGFKFCATSTNSSYLRDGSGYEIIS